MYKWLANVYFPDVTLTRIPLHYPEVYLCTVHWLCLAQSLYVFLIGSTCSLGGAFRLRAAIGAGI